MAVTTRDEQEVWEDIPGYVGMHQVSNLGNIKSLPREVTYSTGRKARYEGRIMTKKVNRGGYELVGLNKNNKQIFYSVHGLVASVFIPNPLNHPHINHKDENKLNNCAYNLEWCTPEYSSNYGTRNQRISRSLQGNADLGVKCRKPVVLVDSQGKSYAFESVSEAASFAGVASSGVSNALNGSGRRKKAGDYSVFRLEDVV